MWQHKPHLVFKTPFSCRCAVALGIDMLTSAFRLYAYSYGLGAILQCIQYCAAAVAFSWQG